MRRTDLACMLSAAVFAVSACDEFPTRAGAPPTGGISLDAEDGTPVAENGPARELLPRTQITFGPPYAGDWSTYVKFRWRDAGRSVRTETRYALVALEDLRRDLDVENPTANQITAWLDTLTYYPDFSGGYFTDSLVWQSTHADSVVFPQVGPTLDRILFAVRGINHAGKEPLARRETWRSFSTATASAGPWILVQSPQAGVTWPPDNPFVRRDLFVGEGIRFSWSAEPGYSGTDPTGFSFAVDDTALWSPFSVETAWPPGGESWRPAPGPHTFFVRAIDLDGQIQVRPVPLLVFAGPRACADGTILVVLDTDPSSLVQDAIWPDEFRTIERGLVESWFAGYDIQVFETHGDTPPPTSLLDCATSVFWFHSTDAHVDFSVLQEYSTDWNPLASYIGAGGNLFLCGLQPVEALRYFESVQAGTSRDGVDPVDFAATLDDDAVVDHWAATRLGVARVERTLGNTNTDALAADRLRLARSRIGGANPYPDLPFDPLTWPRGPERRGFGYYDRDLTPMPGAEAIFDFNDTNLPIAIRRLTSPGVNGNTVYLGFHPYFVGRPEFRTFLEAVLADFGEAPVSRNGTRR